MTEEQKPPSVSETPQEDGGPQQPSSLNAFTPAEQRWYDSIPASLKRVVDTHGIKLFHFTLNRAALEQDLNLQLQQVHSRDSQERTIRLLRATNVLLGLCFELGGWSQEQHSACKRDLDIAVNLAGEGGGEAKLILPAHLKH